MNSPHVFSISIPQPSPHPSNGLYPDKSSWIFSLLSCLGCLVISAFPEEVSRRIPGHLAWDKGGWPHLHTQSPKTCTYCFISPWLLLSKSARTKHLDLEQGGEKNNGKGNQKVWHSFQPGSMGICGAVLIMAVSWNTRLGREADFFLLQSQTGKINEKRRKKLRQVHGSPEDSSFRAGAQCGWKDFGSISSCLFNAFTQEREELFDCSSENK